MREATPVASGSAGTTFGANLATFAFGDFAHAQGSSAFPTRPLAPEPTPATESVAGTQYGGDYNDFDMMESDPAHEVAESVTEGLAGMALNPDAAAPAEGTTNV
ncbi:hypothetical protein AURDEDRAFT_174815 [Auricularia subglabra TFB-10046 SS5]|nr:hypothetical protein AURDEDRAFT_174814 [Auricularia subglabra TFB-10046 SS5]EJD36141.1 hypothetical protein AURDEDRAFT_174815 [Auricularia subglabra TFB-10046 SS5]